MKNGLPPVSLAQPPHRRPRRRPVGRRVPPPAPRLRQAPARRVGRCRARRRPEPGRASPSVADDRRTSRRRAGASPRSGAGRAAAAASWARRPSEGPRGPATAPPGVRREAAAGRPPRTADGGSGRARRRRRDARCAPGGPSSGTSDASACAAAGGTRRAEISVAAVRGVMPQRLDERLIGPDVLLVGAPAEDDAAVGVHVGRETRHEPRLADARLAGHDHEAAAAPSRPASVRCSRLSAAARPTNGASSARASAPGNGTAPARGAARSAAGAAEPVDVRLGASRCPSAAVEPRVGRFVPPSSSRAAVPDRTTDRSGRPSVASMTPRYTNRAATVPHAGVQPGLAGSATAGMTHRD